MACPLPPVLVPGKLVFFDPEQFFYPGFAQHLLSVSPSRGVILAQRHPGVAAGRNLLLQGLIPSNKKARFGVGRQDSQFQPDFYLVVAAGRGEAAGGLVLEREVILGCEATEILRSRIPETLLEALLLPQFLALASGAVGVHHPPGPPQDTPQPQEAARICVWSKSPKWLKVSCHPKVL